MTAPPRGSGAPSEAYYSARGYVQVKVRVPVQTLELWDAAVEHSDAETRTEWVTAVLCAAAAKELGG